MNLKRIGIIFLLILIAVVSCYFLFRNVILQAAVDKVTKKFAAHNFQLTIDESGFQGLSTVFANNISLTPATGDTLISFKKAVASFSFLQLISGNYPVDDLMIENGYIHLLEYPDSTGNYSSLLNTDKNTSEDSLAKTQKTNFRNMFNNVWRNISRLSGLNLLIKDFEFSWTSPGYSEQLILRELTIKNSGFNLNADIKSEGISNSIDIIGTIDPSKGLLEFHGESKDKKITYFPFLKKLSGLNLFSETFGGSMKINSESSDEVLLNIRAAAIRPGVNHWRIGPDDVLMDSIGVNLNLHITAETVQLEAPSHFIVNQLPLSVVGGYTKSDRTQIKINAGFEHVEANAFFNSLPHGLFSSLEGIKTSGKLSYKLVLDVDPDQPDSLIFESELIKDNFKIISFGKENFGFINQDFNYEARENDKVVRVLRVGSDNIFYTPLSNISLVLIGCVLVAEDGTFFFHKGFNEEAFRKSMATNIREKRFARGGSTITMQLVKNVFLSRNKTISRKVEEALIVWLIENQRIVSKERMLEVYLNIIEWGPGIYGIGEAADFYFSKTPMQLNLDECIFLSSIIPRPKYFKYSFEDDGSLRSYLKNYYDVVSGRLLKKEIIGQEEFNNMKYQVELKGKALNIVVPVDSMAIDSIYIDNAGDIFN